MRFQKITAALIIAASTALAGCMATEQDQRAATGAAIGGVGGALAGQAIGRNTGSTIVGAGAGALLGAVIGGATAPRGEQMCRYQARDGSIYTAPCDERYYNGRY